MPIKEFSFEHAMDMAENMLRLAEALAPMEQEEQRLQRKLKEFPEGFHLEGKGYTCFICYNSCSQEDTWYDEYGIKCMTCQDAINRGEIPAKAADKETWYSRYDMENCFGANRHVVKRWVKEGVLKARSVKHNGHEHVQLLIIEDNKDMLPPKELVKSHTVSERSNDGGTTFHMEPWYRYYDPQKHLKCYRILDYLQMTNGRLEPKEK